MTQNRDLITQNFRVEIKHKNGTFVKRDVRSDCYYHGNIHDEVTSLAAVSTCNGVVSTFRKRKKNFYNLIKNDFGNYLHMLAGAAAFLKIFHHCKFNFLVSYITYFCTYKLATPCFEISINFHFPLLLSFYGSNTPNYGGEYS